MTKQTNAEKPLCMIWRDLELIAGEIPRAGDRQAVLSALNFGEWKYYPKNQTGGYGSGQIWQRRVSNEDSEQLTLDDLIAKLRVLPRHDLEHHDDIGVDWIISLDGDWIKWEDVQILLEKAKP